MRGKAARPLGAPVRPGITPAYAGKSYSGGAERKAGEDHPRVCGEKGACRPRRSGTTGSPPRMRGKAENARKEGQADGITPAYAGKSILATNWALRCRDHPRVCGEKLFAFFVFAPDVGSPPRMRGKATNTFRGATITGITPAYAGKRRQKTA